MNITPTTLRKALMVSDRIAVYDTKQQKVVLLFKSVHLCIRYLFPHLIKKKTDAPKYQYLVRIKCCQKKQREELNMFGASLTYRLANDAQKELLSCNDYLVLDENYRNKTYEPSVKGDYSLEAVLEQGDVVQINAGKHMGYVTDILKIHTHISVNTPGTMYYELETPGGVHEFKAHALLLVEKRPVPKEDIITSKFRIDDTVTTRYDVFSETEYDKSGAKNVGRETYIVNDVRFWPQGEGYMIFGKYSDKRSCQVWHHETDLILTGVPQKTNTHE